MQSNIVYSEAMKQMFHINIFKLLYYFIIYKNIHNVYQHLKNNYGNKTFISSILWKKIYITGDTKIIKTVLSKTNLELTYIQNNFNISHNHFNTLNAFNSNSNIWDMLHKTVKHCLGDDIKHIMQKHKNLLVPIKQDDCNFDVNSKLKNYLLTVWAEFSYGSNISIDEYKQIRKELISIIRNNFHNNKLAHIPLIGYLSCYIYYLMSGSKITIIDQKLHNLMIASINSKSGFCYRMFTHFIEKYKLDCPTAFKFTFDSSFLFVLVFDFVYKILLDWILRIGMKESSDNLLYKSIASGFLYPFRYRYINTDIQIDDLNINRGDYVIYNLKDANLYFSWGPRACVGQSMFKDIIIKYFTENIFNEWELVVKPQKIEYNGHNDIPRITKHYNGKWMKK